MRTRPTSPTSITSDEQPDPGDADASAVSELLQLDVADETNAHGRTVRVTLDGELDPHTAPKLQRQVDEALDRGCRLLVLDLGRLRFIDSAGLRVVISAHKMLEAAGGALIIESPSDTARRLLEITGLADHFTIHDGPS